MKIAYFINTFKSINWGGQATSSGIEYMLNHAYPEAQFVPLDLPVLPFKKIKIFRKYYEYKLVQSIMTDNLKQVYYYLKKMNVSNSIFKEFSHICFNGEGAVHYKSGHIRVFLGLLYIAKNQGKVVAAVNQTIDLNNDPRLEAVLSKVYNSIDFVSVREPISYDYAKKIGINDVKLIPDAVYGLPRMNKSEIDERVQRYNLPKKYITVTGSSILQRDKKSLVKMRKLIQHIQEYFHMPIVFMANAKTDIWLAHKLENEFDLTIIEPPTKYQDAMAIIANSEILIGGRQHPNIFAYIYEVPYVPFSGNTFKNEGVAKLQNYSLLPLPWDTNKYDLIKAIEKVYKQKNIFTTIQIDNFKIFGESLNSSPSVKSKSIAIVVTNLAGSGAEKVVLHLAEMFEKHGDEVHVFLLEDVISYDIKGAKIHILSKDRSLFKCFKGFGDKLLAKKLKSMISAIEQEGKKFDLLLSNLPAADRVVAEANLPHTKYLIHTSYSMELNEFKQRGRVLKAIKKEKLYRSLYEGKELIAVSEGIKEDLNKMGIDYATCEVIYNPFDIETIREAGEEKILHEIEGEYLLCASAFRPVKRYDILLKAYCKLTDPIPLKLLCNSDTKLEKMIDELGIRNKVEILGFTSNPYPVIKNAKLLILSSEREGLPTVLPEALILGTPVVSTDCHSGPSEILTEELSQYLAKVNDSDDLSKKITLAIEYYPEIKESHIEKFSAENIYHKYAGLLRIK